MRRFRVVVLAVLALVLAGCAPSACLNPERSLRDSLPTLRQEPIPSHRFPGSRPGLRPNPYQDVCYLN